MPEMPCTAAEAPVTIDMLFGQVKLGTVPSAVAAKPFSMKRFTLGMMDWTFGSSRHRIAEP